LLAIAVDRPAVAQNQAQAQPTAGGSSGLEEIVVTARRREERVMTVPLAVTAFSQAQLEKAQIHDIHDLAQHVPSIAVSQSQSDQNALYSGQLRLRGLPGATVYFSDVPIGNADYQNGTGVQHGLSEGFLYDLDDLEAITGPQGTLFGKNSVGGLINYKPKRPTPNFEGYVQTTFGNYSDKENEFAVNIPVIEDKLMIRVAGAMQQRDGYTEEETQHVDLDNKNWYAWRVGVLMRPTDDIENYFVYDGYWQDMNGSGDIVSFINPGFTFAQIPLPVIGNVPLTLGNGVPLAQLANPSTATAAFLQLLGVKTAGGKPALALYSGLQQAFAAQQALGPRAVLGDNFQKIGKDYFYGFTDEFTWDITDNLTLKNIAAARVFKQLATDDYTPLGSQFPILNIGVPGNNVIWGDNSVQYTEEARLEGRALNDKLTWVFGGFLEFNHPLGDTLLGSAALGQSAAGAVSYFHFHIMDRSRAVFAHGDYSLDDYVEGLKFTAGYRYTWDEESVAARGTSGGDGPPNPCTGTFLTDGNCYQSAPFAHFSSYGWNLGLEEQLTPDILIYVRSGNAYRPGGSNLNVTANLALFQPEHDTDVEIGVKADWRLWGIQARTTADVYHTDYKSIQVQNLVTLIDAAGKTHTNTINLNAATATIEGAEFTGDFLITKDIEIAPHFSYVFPKYDQYPVAFNPLGSETPWLYVPKWEYGITGTYHLPIDESYGDVAISATYSWYGHQYDSVSVGEIYPIEPSYDLLDVRVDWTNAMGYPVDLSFWMKNALDNTYVMGAVPIYTQLGFTSLTYSPPRFWGFTLKYRFGPGTEHEEATAAEPPSSAPPPPPRPAAPKSYLVFFDFDKSALTMEGRTIVDQAAANAGSAHVTQITVTGHTDTVGSDAYNMRLSRRRAESVAAELEAKGVSSNEITLVAKGKRDPLVPTGDGVREPQNRRVEIVYGGGPTS
jgi:iron complex outermembrane receptor protein